MKALFFGERCAPKIWDWIAELMIFECIFGIGNNFQLLRKRTDRNASYRFFDRQVEPTDKPFECARGRHIIHTRVWWHNGRRCGIHVIDTQERPNRYVYSPYSMERLWIKRNPNAGYGSIEGYPTHDARQLGFDCLKAICFTQVNLGQTICKRIPAETLNTRSGNIAKACIVSANRQRDQLDGMVRQHGIC